MSLDNCVNFFFISAKLTVSSKNNNGTKIKLATIELATIELAMKKDRAIVHGR